VLRILVVPFTKENELQKKLIIQTLRKYNFLKCLKMVTGEIHELTKLRKIRNKSQEILEHFLGKTKILILQQNLRKKTIRWLFHYVCCEITEYVQF